MLQVGENEISLRKCSGGTTQLRTLEGTLARYMACDLNLQSRFSVVSSV